MSEPLKILGAILLGFVAFYFFLPASDYCAGWWIKWYAKHSAQNSEPLSASAQLQSEQQGVISGRKKIVVKS